MIKQTEQLGASMLGRVSERNIRHAFGAGSEAGLDIDGGVRDRMLQTLLGKGIQLVDKAIDAKLDREMIEGSTLALAGVAEEELDTNFLTKDWKVAGHRNMTASLRQQEWQAEMLKELTSGDHNDKTPTEYAKHLNEQYQQLVPTIEGMSQQARVSMLEKTITANQTLLSKQASMRAQSIVDSRLTMWQVNANSLLEGANGVKGTSDEGLFAQQAQAFLREVWSDPNTPLDKKIEFAKDFQKAAADMGLAYMADSVFSTPLMDGGNVGQFIPTKDLGKGYAALNKAAYDQRFLTHEEMLSRHVAIDASIDAGTYTGTQAELIGELQNLIVGGAIKSPQAIATLRKFSMVQNTVKNKTKAAEYWQTNNQSGLQRINMTQNEGRDAYIQKLSDSGKTLLEKINEANTVYTTSNGANNIVDWASKEILAPVINQMIHSEGDVLAENLEVWTAFSNQLDNLSGITQENYHTALLAGLSPKQAGFMLEVAAQRKSGADIPTAIGLARETYRKDLATQEVERNSAVQKVNDYVKKKAASKLNDQGMFGNFLGYNWWAGDIIGSQSAQADAKRGTGTWFRTGQNWMVSQRGLNLREDVILDMQEFIRANPSSATEDKIDAMIPKFALERIKGKGDEVVVFQGKSGFKEMFPTATTELARQQDDLIAYTLSNLEYVNPAMKDTEKTYKFSGGRLFVTGRNPNGTDAVESFPVKELEPFIEKYQEDRYKSLWQSEGKDPSAAFNELAQASIRKNYAPEGFKASFKMAGYNNKYKDYAPRFISQVYSDNLPLEGWRLGGYSDDPKGTGRISVGMGVNSGNRTDPRYAKYFDLLDKQGTLTADQAQELTEMAVKDHLRNSASMIKQYVGEGALEKSESLQLAAFKLSYGQWKGDPETSSTRDIFQGVKDGDVQRVIDGFHNSRFFKITCGGDTNNAQYKYVMKNLMGAIDELHTGVFD